MHAEQPVSVQRGAPGTDGQQGKRARGQEGGEIMQQIIRSDRLARGFTRYIHVPFSSRFFFFFNLPFTLSTVLLSSLSQHNTTPVPVTKLSLQQLS